MSQSQKRNQELLLKANTLPLCPGVYIMYDKNRNIIYIGKSRKLKARVSQYFQNSFKNYKTSKMVSLAEDFDFIVCNTEIEALTLENLLIKQHSPKYNIRLKDAKSYPYIKVTNEEYPKILFTRSRTNDKAKYYGPFSGTSVVFSVLDILHKNLGIPTCKRVFPRDIGKERPCIYYQIKQCCGVCTGKISSSEYNDLIKYACDILNGNVNSSKKLLEEKMYEYSEAENFEAAIRCRDTISALDNLNQKQNVVASPDTNMDVFALYSNEFCNVISAMYIRSGSVRDKKDFVFSSDTIIDSSALVSFLVEHYSFHSQIPKTISVSFDLDEEDIDALTSYLEEKAAHKVTLKKPERGNVRKLTETVLSNASEKARLYAIESEKKNETLFELAKLLELQTLPERIEAYDVSNIGNENITAGMIVFRDGKPSKKDYRSFKMKEVKSADDYSSMREALARRLSHLINDTSGSFSEYPDLILIDGGKNHVSVVKEVLDSYSLSIPVFGMVKDDFHKTRALCNEADEINIAKNKQIFNFIYKIQEEVHRFTVSKTMNAKRSTLKHSVLEKIEGIGPSKAKKLMIEFGTVTAIKKASLEELTKVKGISDKDAQNIYNYYNGRNGG